jgi:hypothetical protein
MSWSLRHFAAEIFCNTVTNSTLNREQNPDSAEVAKAIAWDRHNSEYWYKLAQAIRRERSGQAGYLDDMTAALEKALLLNPFAAIYYLELGWTATQRWNEVDFAEKWLPNADQAMDLAGLYSGARDPRMHNDVADYWLMRSRTLEPASNAWETALEKAWTHFQQVLSLEKGKRQDDLREDIRAIVWNYYPDHEILNRMGLEKKGEEQDGEKGEGEPGEPAGENSEEQGEE